METNQPKTSEYYQTEMKQFHVAPIVNVRCAVILALVVSPKHRIESDTTLLLF
jgi:hypothetical protein